jgi:UDP-N-acetyl-D-mannosaminuronic acid transferase (WecB/TagA/CpsF family)
MLQNFQGSVVEGKFDPDYKDFTVTKVKNVSIEIVLDKESISEICRFLEQNQEDETLVTVNSQVFVKLHSDEVFQALSEFRIIQSYLTIK